MTNITTNTGAGDPLAQLAQCRAEIEEIDSQLIALLATRIALGRRTATLKRAARAAAITLS